MNPPVHVAVGVILDSQRKVLISLRHADSHQGGLWEFPGGKLEQNETLAHALKRELAEELGIQVKASSPFVKLLHHYSDKTVLLDVCLITEFDGIPSGLEGQSIKWCSIDRLVVADFPAANQQIIKLLQRPDRLAKTPD
jgi:8-oxo-dGTP diphosphatase